MDEEEDNFSRTSNLGNKTITIIKVVIITIVDGEEIIKIKVGDKVTTMDGVITVTTMATMDGKTTTVAIMDGVIIITITSIIMEGTKILGRSLPSKWVILKSLLKIKLSSLNHPLKERDWKSLKRMGKYLKINDSLPIHNHYVENGEILPNGRKLNGLQFLRELKILK